MEENVQSTLSKDSLIFSNDVAGIGAFGKVYIATLKNSNKKVAVKTVFQDKNYKNRELSIMQELNHPNIIKLLGFYYTDARENNPKASKNDVNLNCIMDYIPETLSHLISKNKKENTDFNPIIMKLLSFQLLKSIGYMQSKGICHRDIKPSNVLIDPYDYTLKICDFGCAKILVKDQENISYICSRYYRPPELVLGANFYTCQVDVWSIGCVIAELVLKKPIFAGSNSKNQMVEIMKILGTPNKNQIYNMNPHIKSNVKFMKLPKKNWKDVFNGKIRDDNYIDLVSKLIVYEPDKRLKPYEALCHSYFDELKDKNLILPNGTKIPSHIFEFEKCEMEFDKENINKFLSQVKN